MPLAAATASARPCLIVNPLSFQVAASGLARKAARLAQESGAEVIEVRDRAQLAAELERLCAEQRTRLFILAGDGTVQGIVQYLAMLPPSRWQPELLVLGGGRSNVTANEFGHGSPLRTLREALRRCSVGASIDVHEQPLLRVEQADHPPQHGFLLAGAVIDAAIRLCDRFRQSGNSWLHRGKLSSQYCLAKLALQIARGRSPLPADPDLQIRVTNEVVFENTCRVLMASALAHRNQWVNPYAACGTGPVRLTAIAANAQGLWRRLPRVLTGHFTADMRPEQGYLSGRFERVEILGLASFSLDGEMFEPDHQRPVIIQAGPTLRMLQL
jgi:hypothetical protein